MLRQHAEQQLLTGTAQLSSAFTASADALAGLYRLTSVANTASDGLKLLHELQTYQVELDLQLEQLQDNERECSHELACYRQFFAINPVACLILSLDGIITNSNAAAAHLFAASATQLCGRSMLSLLSATCQPMFSATLARMQRNPQSATLLVNTISNTTSSTTGSNDLAVSSPTVKAQSLRLTINLSPDHSAILIMLT
jgi:PAS domain-containing protein